MTHNTIQPGGGGGASRLTTTGLVVAFALAPLWTAEAEEPNICTSTARLAFRACQNEARDDFLIAAGRCKNQNDQDAREECRAEAEEERDDALQSGCQEQKAARLDLCEALGEAPYDPVIDPEAFLTPAEAAANPNPYYPLVPGQVRRYVQGEETITVTVTHETREILGVTTTVIHDVVEIDGVPVEDTLDYYAQHENGDVWYMGEIAQNFDDEGHLTDTEGSWIAGEDLARPGIIMPATPMVGQIYRQEFLLGDAEDVGEVLAVDASATVPAASCDGTCIETRDGTPIEPDVEEHKYYAPGIGVILEVDIETGERVELVEFTPGA